MHEHGGCTLVDVSTISRGLSPSQLHAWQRFLQVNTDARRAVGRDLTEQSGLTESDYTILLHLAGQDACIRATSLAEAIEWEPSRLSHQLRRLEARGYIRRSADDGDGRASLVIITDAGRTAMRDAGGPHLSSVAEWFFEPLDDADVAALTRILDTVRGHIRHRSGVETSPDCPCVADPRFTPTTPELRN